MEKFEEALKMLKKSRKIAQLQDRDELLEYYINLGTCYERLGNTNEAFKTFMKIVDYERYLKKTDYCHLGFKSVLEPIVRAMYKAGKMKFLLGDNYPIAIAMLKQFCYAFEKCNILQEKDSYLDLHRGDYSDLIILETDEERFLNAQEMINAKDNQEMSDSDRLPKDFKERLHVIASNLCKFEKPQIIKEATTEEAMDIEKLRILNKEIEMKSKIMEEKEFIKLFRRKGDLLLRMEKESEAVECFDKYFDAYEADLKLTRKLRWFNNYDDIFKEIQDYHKLLEKHGILGDHAELFHLYLNEISLKNNHEPLRVAALNMAGIANLRIGSYQVSADQLMDSIDLCQGGTNAVPKDEEMKEIFDANMKRLPKIQHYCSVIALIMAKSSILGNNEEDLDIFIHQAKEFVKSLKFDPNSDDTSMLNIIAAVPYRLSSVAASYTEAFDQMNESLSKFSLSIQ